MKFIPILFSTPMVQAIINSRKTQTRRIIKEAKGWDINWKVVPIKEKHLDGIQRYEIRCGTQYHLPWFKAKYEVGDVLWVRETFFYGGEMDENEQVSECRYWYKAESDWGQFEWVDENENLRNGPKWKPSIFMPKQACRIFLEVTDIRVEKLQDITEEDAQLEGITKPVTCNYTDGSGGYLSYAGAFADLWAKINGPSSWAANPWVWVISFKQIDKPDNFLF